MKYRLPYPPPLLPTGNVGSPFAPMVEDEEIDDMARPTDRSRASSNAETQPSSYYFAKALPANEGGFTAQYGMPGLLPTRLKGDNGQVAVFMSAEEAETAATKALVAVLNSRSMSLRGKDKPERYRKLTAAEFAMLLDRAGLSPTFLAYLYGTDPARVMKWIEGLEDIPHPLRVLLEILVEFPGAATVAERVTDEVTTLINPKVTK